MELFLEKLIELLAGVIGRDSGARFAGEVNGLARLKIIAGVGPILVALPLGLRLAAFLLDRRIKETAILANVNRRAATLAGG